MTPTADAPSSSEKSAAPPTPRPPRRKKWVWITTALVLTALAGTLVGGEIYARASVEGCLNDQFEQALGSKVDIGLSSRPMLWQLVTKEVPYVTVASDDTRFGTAVGMQVRARANDISIERDSKRAGSIGNSRAEVKWPTTGIAATLKSSAFGGLVQDVKANSAEGTLELALGPAGLGQLSVKPQLKDGAIDVSAQKASVMGFGFPTTVVDGIVKLFSTSLQNYPLGMRAESLVVTDSGVELRLAGGQYDMPLPENAPASNNDPNPSDNTNTGGTAAQVKPKGCSVP